MYSKMQYVGILYAFGKLLQAPASFSELLHLLSPSPEAFLSFHIHLVLGPPAAHPSQQAPSPASALSPHPPQVFKRTQVSPTHAIHDTTLTMQVDLMSCIKQILFPAALESIFGAAFLQHHSSKRLQTAFFAFEEGFELAASPVPHFLQPTFSQGRRALLEAFR